MASKLFRDISASTLQVVVNQLAGAAVFLLTSLYLPKEVFGELNWSVAVMTFATTLLSLRLEQLLVKKAAAGQDISGVMTIFGLHVLCSGLFCWLLLLLCSYLFPAFFSLHALLVMISISQLISFFSSPFKQVANGKERFGLLAVMSSSANIVRAAGLAFTILFSGLTVERVLLIFIAGSVAELLVSYYLVAVKMGIKLTSRVRLADYFLLLKESVHQIGAALLMAGIARMDWILLGVFSTAAFTADYSFAYRVFELSPVPLLIIAPVLLSRFAKFFSVHTEEDLLKKKDELSTFVRAEMLLATFIPLVLNLSWIPLLEPLSRGKYGHSNATVFLLLSCCTPFQYITNLLWTIRFTQHKLKQVLQITAVTFMIILAGDLILIPVGGKTAAAAVFLCATVVEYINYLRTSSLSRIKETWTALLTCMAIAFTAGLLSVYFFRGLVLQLALASAFYCLLAMATGQIRKSDTAGLRRLIRKKRNPPEIPAAI
ncbi:MAG: oligosaccharide flippase family protein [Chitinophagaceae bacterium]